MLISPQRILTPEKVQVSIHLYPAYNALLSMIALLNPDNYGGVDNWAKDTVHQMGEDLHQQHRFLLGAAGLDGLTNVVRSAEGLASFEGFSGGTEWFRGRLICGINCFIGCLMRLTFG